MRGNVFFFPFIFCKLPSRELARDPRLIKNSDDVLSQCQYLAQSYAAIFISSTAPTKGATRRSRGPLLKMKFNGVEWGWVEVNIQSGPICGLISTPREVACWSGTAAEGSSQVFTHQTPTSFTCQLFQNWKMFQLFKSETLTPHFWCWLSTGDDKKKKLSSSEMLQKWIVDFDHFEWRGCEKVNTLSWNQPTYSSAKNK